VSDSRVRHDVLNCDPKNNFFFPFTLIKKFQEIIFSFKQRRRSSDSNLEIIFKGHKAFYYFYTLERSDLEEG
jgi:hypothetical protein